MGRLSWIIWIDSIVIVDAREMKAEEVLTTEVRQRKEIKCIQTGREKIKCHYLQII